MCHIPVEFKGRVEIPFEFSRCPVDALRSEALPQQSRTRRRTASKPTSPQPMVGLVPIAQTTGMIGGQHTCVYCPVSCCTHARTHARTYRYTITPWFTITGTRTLMSHERVDQVDSHGRWKGPCLQTNPQCDPVSQHHLHHVDESTPTAPHRL
jgi:hypothetical protein